MRRPEVAIVHLSNVERNMLKDACAKLGDGEDYRCENIAENLVLTALDFQMNVREVNKYFAYFQTKHRLKTMRGLENLLAGIEDTRTGNRELAQSLWGCNHWTRATFLRVIVARFRD
jgi:hypothetical protein